MCGIAGIVKENIIPSDVDTINRMCEKMAFRGPDDQGILSFRHVVLGHLRLSIIDLSKNASQPMSSSDGRFHITYNGEIYNFKDIKTDLINKGYKFKSKSDTEVVLYSFVEYGENCLNKFNGFFAFAIWDEKEKNLFLARDRFGKKPLFYYVKKGSHFTFASDIRALKKDNSIPSKLSLAGLNHYLSIGYILNPLTIYEDIFLLEPASYMYVSATGHIIKKHRYWNYSDTFQNKTKDKEPDILNNIIELLKLSIKRRMISDVPVGALLSGGIDSSSIVAFMKNYHKNELHTFSVGFENENYNELPDANKVASLIGTKHHGLIVGENNPIELLNNSISAFDQPFADNSLIPMVEVSKLASKYVKVILSGDGADEIFAGYITYKADKLYPFTKIIPHELRKVLSKRHKSNIDKKIDWRFKKQQFFYGSLFDYKKAHYFWRVIFQPEERVKILGEQYRDIVYDTDPFLKFEEYYNHVKNLDILDQHLFVDAMTWLTDDILYKVDRSSMHNSIEARTPYLDIDLVTYAASIQSKLKMRGLNTKSLLKNALSNTLPEFVLSKRKSGFNTPISSFLSNNKFNEFQDFNLFVLERFKDEYTIKI